MSSTAASNTAVELLLVDGPPGWPAQAILVNRGATCELLTNLDRERDPPGHRDTPEFVLAKQPGRHHPAGLQLTRAGIS